MRYEGSCHCGRIRYEVEGELSEVYDCNCSHCSRKGYLLWFVPRQQLTLLTPEADMSRYTFNHHRISHHFCPVCGCAPLAFGKSPDGSDTACVNVRCLPEVDRSSLKITPVDGKRF